MKNRSKPAKVNAGSNQDRTPKRLLARTSPPSMMSRFVAWYGGVVVFFLFSFPVLLFHERVMTWLFRIFTLLSVSYLIFDRLYEMDATISATGNDKNDPLQFPFALINNSHIFSIREVNWVCHIDKFKYENNAQIDNVGLMYSDRGLIEEIPPGGIFNLKCSSLISGGDAKLQNGKIDISEEYTVDIFGIYNWRRKPRITTFTWYVGDTDGHSQWVKGAF
jgi:hypothetical protein